MHLSEILRRSALLSIWPGLAGAAFGWLIGRRLFHNLAAIDVALFGLAGAASVFAVTVVFWVAKQRIPQSEHAARSFLDLFLMIIIGLMFLSGIIPAVFDVSPAVGKAAAAVRKGCVALVVLIAGIRFVFLRLKF